MVNQSSSPDKHFHCLRVSTIWRLMRRIKIGFVVKLGAVVITLLLLGPYLFHLKLNENASDDAEDYRQWQLRRNAALKKASEKPADALKQPEGVIKAGDSPVKIAVEEKTEHAFYKKGEKGNFEPAPRKHQDRPGEGGSDVKLSASETALAQESVREFGFNMVASDKVAMDRKIPDTRPNECIYWHYPEKQPTASVILVFHNEGFSTLVRTIHSVINTSPPQYLKEVVLVDDFSDKVHLKTQLEDYIKQFKGLVKLYRNSQREGLIRTRSRGAELSTGDVIVFLDAHCECNKNWLVPLLDRIRLNRNAMAVPIVDGIDYNTMAYHSVYGKALHRGIFEWGFFYKEAQVPEKELRKREYASEPYWSPTHAGGLFAMNREYFHELGGYDPGLKIWGGENYELSFKIWQCGGIVEWVPCSHVGHIYRNHMPYGLGKDVDPHMSPIYINYMRVVEVWMEDEFKEYFYTREPSFRGYNFGNITKQLQFKKDHNCKSFRWFMDNIAYDVYDQYPKPPPNKAWGEIRSRSRGLCWDPFNIQPSASPVGLSNCHGLGSSQQFRLNVKGQIGVSERCILAQNADTLHVSYCETQPIGPWEWDQESGTIRHRDLNKCVMAGSDRKLHLQFCNSKDDAFKWDINEVYPWKRS